MYYVATTLLIFYFFLVPSGTQAIKCYMEGHWELGDPKSETDSNPRDLERHEVDCDKQCARRCKEDNESCKKDENCEKRKKAREQQCEQKCAEEPAPTACQSVKCDGSFGKMSYRVCGKCPPKGVRIADGFKEGECTCVECTTELCEGDGDGPGKSGDTACRCHWVFGIIFAVSLVVFIPLYCTMAAI